MATKKHASKNGKAEPTVIKKYANRRLYDTGRSSYVTLSDLCEMVQKGHDFVVLDAKSGEDLTRSVLTQIIAEQEAQEGNNMLPTSFLKNLISFYGDNIGAMVPNYLESTFDVFVKNQEQLREQLGKLPGMDMMKNMQNAPGMKDMSKMFPQPGALPPVLEEMKRQNIAMFEQTMNTMKMFNPFMGDSKSSNKD